MTVWVFPAFALPAWLLGSASAAPRPPSVDDPVRTGADSPDAALVVGIEDYAFVADVPYAQRDADAFGDLLVSTRGLRDDRVLRLRGANREQMVRGVAEAAGRVGPGGRVWLYFSGHGAANPSDGRRMLLGNDVTADPMVFQERAVTVDELREAAGGAAVVFVLDTCYGGVGRAGEDLYAGRRFAVPSYAVPLGEQDVSWTASSANQLAAPLHGAEHGAFTYFTLGALRGWADGELDGTRDAEVSLEEARRYVARMLRTAGLSQQPELVADPGVALIVTAGPRLEPPPDWDGVDWSALPAGPAPTTAPATQLPGCPWERVVTASATMTRVTVNGTEYDAQGNDRPAFEAVLQACQLHRSYDGYLRWRHSRRTVNTLAAYPPMLLGPVFFPAGAAGTRREEFVRALLANE